MRLNIILVLEALILLVGIIVLIKLLTSDKKWRKTIVDINSALDTIQQQINKLGGDLQRTLADIQAAKQSGDTAAEAEALAKANSIAQQLSGLDATVLAADPNTAQPVNQQPVSQAAASDTSSTETETETAATATETESAGSAAESAG
jgi:cytoskeletal protein RodZ